MKRWFACIVLAVLVAFAHCARAQDTAPEEPQLGSQAAPGTPEAAPPEQTLPAQFGGADGIYRVLVIGDNLAGGLGSGLKRVAAADEVFEIVTRGNESSGFARPEVYDWNKSIPKIMQGKSFDAVVVIIGVNDRQAIRNGSFRYVFRSPEWIAAYKARVEAVIATLRAQDARIFWVGLPPVANDAFDADMLFLTDLQAEKLTGDRIHFVDIRSFFANPDGSLIDQGLDESGANRKYRTKDGIGFLKFGNDKLGKIVLAAIKNAEGTPAAAPVAAAPQAEVAAPATAESALFGQAGPDDATLTYEANVIARTKGREPVIDNSAPTRLGLSVARNTLAEKFYRLGEVVGAPRGRFDDFTYTPPAASP